ncbi:MAG: branched-chain amino acid ABC transporter permease [Armatimonadetes bacterium]|nr:branched-chain amino acid ABC transporter permease [Armatimonadota bacterium]
MAAASNGATAAPGSGAAALLWFIGRVVVVCVIGAALAGASILLTENLETYYFLVLIQCGIAAVLAVSLNLINGITGQFSIGHAGFYAVGAYVGTAWTMLWRPMLAKSAPFLEIGTLAGDALNLVIAMLLGSIAAAVTGVVVGTPSLRLRGDYLAILTLGFGEVIRVVLLNIDAVGGARGLAGIPTLVSTGGLAAFWVFSLLIAVALLTRNLMRSTRGLTWLAVREDEIASDAMGVDTTKVKVTAFVVGSASAGAAGVLYAHFFTGISPDIFGMDVSILITTMVVLAGTGSVTGAIIAGFALTALPEALRFLKDFKEYRMVFFSTALILMMLTRPQGILGHAELGFGSFARLWGRIRRRTRSAAA